GGLMRHGMDRSFFRGTSTARGGGLWHKKLLKPLWGTIPAWAVVGTLFLGMVCTLTVSGYAALLICTVMLGIATCALTRWVLLILPLASALWMAGRYTNVIDASLLLDTAKMIDSNRSDSLEYRLVSERANLDAASDSLILGKSSTMGVARLPDGRYVMAVDAWWMITLIFFGVVGLGGWLLVWSAGWIAAFARWGK